MPAPLDVFAALSLTTDDGKVISVQGEKNIVAVELPDVWSSYSLIRRFAAPEQRPVMLGNMQQGLLMADLTLEFRVSSRRIARLRPQSRPNWLSRLLGLGSLEINPFALLLAVFRL